MKNLFTPDYDTSLVSDDLKFKIKLWYLKKHLVQITILIIWGANLFLFFYFKKLKEIGDLTGIVYFLLIILFIFLSFYIFIKFFIQKRSINKRKIVKKYLNEKLNDYNRGLNKDLNEMIKVYETLMSLKYS